MEEDRYTRITLRIPKDLHSQLQQAADDTSKSMNAEIVARLQRSFNDEQAESKERADLERGAEAIGYAPGTPAYEGAIEALRAEVRLAMQEEARSFLGRIATAAEMQRNAPEIFKMLLDADPQAKPSKKPKE